VEVIVESTSPGLVQFLEERFSSDCHVRMVTEENLAEAIVNGDVLIPGHMKVDSGVLGRARQLKLIQCGAGYDNVDLQAASLKRIYVANTPEANAISVAEHVFALMLALSRRLVWIDASMKSGRWEKPGILLSELAEKTLGIVGLGNIGIDVARRGLAFRMRILSFRQRPIVPEGLDVALVDLPTLLGESDFLSIHVPLTENTKGMLREKELRLMKPTAFLINTSRGGIVDEKALYSALVENRLAGAALDVFEEEPLPADSVFRRLDNVILTPHVAGRTFEALQRRYLLFSENIMRVRDGGIPSNLVNRF
jgi:D-3-phosphoglycerate dehydrogenase